MTSQNLGGLSPQLKNWTAKVNEIIHENQEIHQTATVEKLNNGLTNVNKNIGLGCKKIVW